MSDGYEPMKHGEYPEIDRLEAQTQKVNEWLAIVVLILALTGWIWLIVVVTP